MANKLNASVIRTRWQRKLPAPKPAPTPAPAPAPVQPVVQAHELLLNDPTTPDLVQLITNPPMSTNPPIVVKNYKGGGQPKGSEPWQAANCMCAINNTLVYYTAMHGKALPRWPGTSILAVLPRAGVDLNAYYDRRSLRFFYASHPLIGGSLFTCDSADIVTHELGHAILDSFRPDLWSAMSIEAASFHEAFADFTAIMHILTYDKVIERAFIDAGGDIKNPNVATRLAEQFGKAIYKLAPNDGRDPDCLRSAINSFKYVDPATLPEDAPHNQLAKESHSFGRVFLGAFWDMLVVLFNDFRTTGLEPIPALKQARDVLTKYTLRAIQQAPNNAKFFESVGKTLLWVDVTTNNRRFHDKLQQVLVDRNIVTPQVSAMAAGTQKKSSQQIVRTKNTMRLKLSHAMLSTQSNNPLYHVEVEVPNESVHLYDSKGNYYDSCSCCKDDAIAGACEMVNYLHKKNAVSHSEKTPWMIKSGKLVRSHIS